MAVDKALTWVYNKWVIKINAQMGKLFINGRYRERTHRLEGSYGQMKKYHPGAPCGKLLVKSK